MAEVLVAFSDCIEVATSHDETYLLEYSNQYDFAGIEYTDLELTFGIRIHARFFKERFPEENESEGLSDESVVKLSSETKAQKLLEIEPAPYYFHQQMKLILQHNKVTLDGEDWQKEDAYEMEDLADRNPFATAKSWLTRKEGDFFTNVYGEV